MNFLKQNIIKMFGEKGNQWLDNLPVIVSELQKHWELSDFTPVENMSFNYVAKAITRTHQPVVLKIGYDEKSILDEMKALHHFDGHGSVQIISYYSKYHALLLQQAIPGVTLKSVYPSQVDYVMDCYIDVVKKLHSNRLFNKNDYHSIRDWLAAIDHFSSCPSDVIKKAILLKNKLLSSLKNEVLLHGDLHHDNILKHQDHWLAIDPKGIIGEPEFELAAFDFLYIDELAKKNNAKEIIENSINLLARKANLNFKRIRDWVFIRLILMAAWKVEDNDDPSAAIKLAEQIY